MKYIYSHLDSSQLNSFLRQLLCDKDFQFYTKVGGGTLVRWTRLLITLRHYFQAIVDKTICLLVTTVTKFSLNQFSMSAYYIFLWEKFSSSSDGFTEYTLEKHV